MQLFLNSLPIKTGYAERDCSQDCSHRTHANPSLMGPSQSGTICAKGAAYKISSHKYGIGPVGSLRHLLYTAAPFTVFEDYIEDLFKTPVFFFATLINFFGNLAIFVPIGFFPALLFRDANWKRSAIIGFGMSALIELAQYFIMRNVAVDDIILNTAGAICGYLLYLFIRKHWTNFTDGFLCREVSKG